MKTNEGWGLLVENVKLGKNKKQSQNQISRLQIYTLISSLKWLVAA